MPRTHNGNSRQRRQRREREALSAAVDHGRLLLTRERLAQSRIVAERTRGSGDPASKADGHHGKLKRRNPRTQAPAREWSRNADHDRLTLELAEARELAADAYRRLGRAREHCARTVETADRRAAEATLADVRAEHSRWQARAAELQSQCANWLTSETGTRLTPVARERAARASGTPGQVVDRRQAERSLVNQRHDWLAESN